MPKKWEAKVWRYVSLASLLSILQSKSLFLTRVEKFDDPYEGEVPEGLRKLFGDAATDFGEHKLKLVTFLESQRNFSCVSCWHLNEVESAAMWKLYSADSGVAIQSSVGGLIQGLFATKDIKMALVQYIDFETDEPPELLHPVYLKRKSFSHENELRVVLHNFDRRANPDGLFVPADLSKLIERIYVSPSAPSWTADVVRKELAMYGLTAEVISSTLYSRDLK